MGNMYTSLLQSNNLTFRQIEEKYVAFTGEMGDMQESMRREYLKIRGEVETANNGWKVYKDEEE
jgi:hypothetical protein